MARAAASWPRSRTTALELARLAGAEIQSALGRTLAVRYKKSADGAPAFRDPVSEVDHAVEALIRARLAERFPAHEIIGEEIEEAPGGEHDFAVGDRPGRRHHQLRQRLPAVRGLDRHPPPRPPGGRRALVLDQPRAARRRLPCPRGRRAALRGRAADARGARRRCGAISPASRGASRRRRRALGRAPDRLGGDRMRLRRRGPAARRALRRGRNIWDVAGGVALVAGGGRRGAHQEPAGLGRRSSASRPRATATPATRCGAGASRSSSASRRPSRSSAAGTAESGCGCPRLASTSSGDLGGGLDVS